MKRGLLVTDGKTVKFQPDLRDKPRWRLVLDSDPLAGKYQPHQQDLAWVGPDVWRLVTTKETKGDVSEG